MDKNAKRFMVFTEKLSAFSEGELSEGVWIHASPKGEFKHPVYGEVAIDDERIARFVRNFENNVFGQDVPIYYEHFGMDQAKGMKAAGWINEMEQRDDGMWWKVKFSEQATAEIKAGEWRYFSPEWYNEWTDPETQVTHKDVAVGGALVNQPFYKNMVPLNFSELAAEVANEVADWEHSEPGSGPTPREDDPDDTNAQGVRGPSPDVEPDPDAYDVEDSMEEFLKKLGELLKLEGEPTEDTVLAAFAEYVNEAQPIRDAIATANEQQTFSERFPAEFARMQALEESDRANKAQAFSDKYATARVVKTSGEGDDVVTTPTPYGFSGLAIEKIKDLHLAFSTNTLTEKHISDVFDAMLNNGMVDYSEHGSSRVTEMPATPEDAKMAFAEKVREVVREDQVDQAAAVRIAGEKYPELAKAYAEATRTK
jgi:phage I-like protein